MRRVMGGWAGAVAAIVGGTIAIAAQAPQPPRTTQPAPAPRPGAAAPAPQAPAAPAPQAPAAPAPQAPAAPAPQAAADGRPTEQELWGVPVYPSAVFLRSYDAGRGQKYYIFGSTVPFGEMVAYYKNVTKDKGNLVFEVPPTHVFEIAKFREETMAFPPTVTIKDYTFSGSAGYPNPKAGAQPERFPTLIQIVPPPAGTVK